MGNDVEENNLNQINKEEIIENDCYEEIDLNKINKIIEKEKSWNKNSIIVSLNELDLKKLNEDNENIEGNKEKEKKNEELACKVIEEQKNEEGSEDGKNKENKENEQNEQNNNNNDNNANNDEKEKEKEEKEKEEKEKKELNENKNDNNNEVNKNEINNEINNNEANDKVNGIINISNRQDENKKEDAPKENNNADNTKDAKDAKDTKDNNNNKDNAGDNNDKNNQEKEKIKNKVKKGKKPRIRPKNTSDEALKGANGKIVKYRKQRNNNNNNINNNNNNNNDKSPNQKDGKEDNNAKNDNNKNDPNKNEKKINNPPVEKKDPAEEFDIKNIISEYRLNHLKEDEIIYSGTLDKILKIPDKNTIAYSQRFCIFTKNYFAYYKSKESYISLNKPMLLINNKYIIRIENTILDGGSYYFGIICEVNDETRSLINKVNSFVTNEANTCELLLGFRTKEYENMMKWVVVLRYFISNQKEDF